MPDPDGPMIAVKLCAANSMLTPSQRVHRLRPAAVGLADVVEPGDDRGAIGFEHAASLGARGVALPLTRGQSHYDQSGSRLGCRA